MNSNLSLRKFPALWAWAMLLCASGWPISSTAQATGFAALVSPPRFELKAKPGELLNELVDIGNDDTALGDYQIRSADWDLSPEGGTVIHPEELRPGSCRPWVRIERRTLKLAPQATKKYRFEIQVPADAPTGECRFALLIESAPDKDTLATAGNIKFPIQGRIAVIVYVVVGDASPKLEFRGISLAQVNGTATPVATLYNGGNAHGRPEGILAGTDSQGHSLDFTIASLPIFPNETRTIPIWPPDDPNTKKPASFTAPLKLKGKIEWEGGGYEVDTSLQGQNEPVAVAPQAKPEPVPPVATEAAPASATPPAEPVTAPATKSVTPAPPANASSQSGTTWAVQLAAMSNEQNAVTLRDKLLAKGYMAFIESAEGVRGKTFLVRVGPQPERAAADTMRDTLEKEFNLKGIVVRSSS